MLHQDSFESVGVCITHIWYFETLLAAVAVPLTLPYEFRAFDEHYFTFTTTSFHIYEKIAKTPKFDIGKFPAASHLVIYPWSFCVISLG